MEGSVANEVDLISQIIASILGVLRRIPYDELLFDGMYAGGMGRGWEKWMDPLTPWSLRHYHNIGTTSLGTNRVVLVPLNPLTNPLLG